MPLNWLGFDQDATLPLTSSPKSVNSNMSYGLSDDDETHQDIAESPRRFFVGDSGVLHEPRQDRSRLVRIVIGVFLGLTLVFIVVDSFTNRYVEHASLAFLEWVQQNPFLGVLAVIVVFTLATILFVPGAVLTIGTGFAFGTAFDNAAQGILLASTAVFFGASCGSICSFLLGRYLFRDCVMSMASKYPVFQAVDRALQGNGLKIMILLRLSPLIPYNALDYMSGVTSIPLWAYAVALVAMLPGTVMFTFIGATASSLSDSASGSSENKTVRIISLVFGVTFAIVGVAVASYYSKLELNKILEAESDPSHAGSSSPLNEESRESELTGLDRSHGNTSSPERYHDVDTSSPEVV